MSQEGFYTEKGWGSAALRETLEDREEIVLRQFAKELGSRKRALLLDVGCGDGCFLRGVSRLPGVELHGVDGSEEQIKKAQATLPSARLNVQDVLKPLAYPDQTFDIVYCGEVIEHVTDPDGLVEDMMRVLKKGGLLVLTTPNLFAWYNRVLILFGLSPLFVEYSTRDASVGYGVLKRFKQSSMPVGHLRIFHPNALEDILVASQLQGVHLSAARFEYLPGPLRLFDHWISRIWPRGASILIGVGRKPS